MSQKNPYKVLGLKEDATEREIKSAYKELALKWHPDKNPNDKERAKRKFQEISEAYQMLTNKDRRRSYDRAAAYDSHGAGRPRANSHAYHTSAAFSGLPREFFDEFDDFAPFGRFPRTSAFMNPMDLFNEIFGDHMQDMNSVLRRHRDFDAFPSPFMPIFQNFDSVFDDMSGNLNSKGYMTTASASYSSANPGGTFMRFESRTFNDGQCKTVKKTYENGVETKIVEQNGKVVSKSINQNPKYSNKPIKGH